MGMMQEKWLLHTVGSRSSNPEDVKSEDKNGLCLDEGIHGPASRPKKGVRESFPEEWMMEFPIINECTHYACIMDPLTGKVRWLQRGMIEYDPGNPRF
jgi:hypothetical protein